VSAVSAPYHPGQSPWPDNQPQRPDRPPPIQFRPDDQAPRGNPVLAWTLRIIGLVAIAAISGVVWWYIQKDNPGSPSGFGGGETKQQSSGAFDFTAKLEEPRVETDCAEHAYGQIQQFLTDKPCDKLTRGIYTTTVDGRTIFTSVAVVQMPDEATAGELRQLTDTDGTGNVNDLVREGVVPIAGLKSLSNGGGYDSAQQQKEVVIVESDYDPQAGEGGSEGELEEVCTDAIRLGGDMVDQTG
jgi:hypothetical protein